MTRVGQGGGRKTGDRFLIGSGSIEASFLNIFIAALVLLMVSDEWLC